MISKLIIAGLLILISVLPASDRTKTWEDSLRGAIDNEEVQEIDIADPGSTPSIISDAREVAVTAEAAFFVDINSGEYLVEKAIDKKLSIASLTKLMTALIAVEETSPDDVITVPPGLAVRSDDSRMWLVAGDKLTSNELLHGVLIASGSDAALTFASHISGSTNDFVELMNDRAELLGLRDTHFGNPVGWDEADNYSTAQDMAALSRIALTNPEIREIVAKRTYIANSQRGRPYILTNTNLLIGQTYKGIKTGTTYGAGQCLTTYYTDGDREIIGVVLGSTSRFSDTTRTIEYIKENFSW
ncbi:MAG: hypothetical protein PHW75_01415 [Patescibacteria group bacterium]|nr:hypothetical protein [Patescibacteria group bacterium]